MRINDMLIWQYNIDMYDKTENFNPLMLFVYPKYTNNL